MTSLLRDRFKEVLKEAMKAQESLKVSTLRMILSKLKDLDIAARPAAEISEAEIVAMLRGMIKSRKESAKLYKDGGRAELAEKEEAEIGIIEEFLPQTLRAEALQKAVDEAIKATGAAGMKDMGKVVAFLKEKHQSAFDATEAAPLIKAGLST